MDRGLDKRLGWRCRRGTREMDFLLERFLQAVGGDLDEDTRAGLEQLLDQPDRNILDWLARRTVPPSPGLAAVVDRIRDAALPVR